MNIESLSLDQMRTALIVAETGSFSGAARRLSRKQSAVSYAISTLERQLGLALFDRSDGQKPVPTPVGSVLLREMEAVVRSADEIKKKALAAARGLEAEVAMALDSFYPAAELVAVLHGFADQFRRFRFASRSNPWGASRKASLKASVLSESLAATLISLPA